MQISLFQIPDPSCTRVASHAKKMFGCIITALPTPIPTLTPSPSPSMCPQFLFLVPIPVVLIPIPVLRQPVRSSPCPTISHPIPSHPIPPHPTLPHPLPQHSYLLQPGQNQHLKAAMASGRPIASTAAVPPLAWSLQQQLNTEWDWRGSPLVSLDDPDLIIMSPGIWISGTEDGGGGVGRWLVSSNGTVPRSSELPP